MNRYEFENLISDYLEGELSFIKRKEFESYLDEDDDAKLLFFEIKKIIKQMKNVEKISTSKDFNFRLLSIIKDKTPLKPNHRSTIFGLSPLDASIFSSLCLGVVIIGYSLFAPNLKSEANFEYYLDSKDNINHNTYSQKVENDINLKSSDELDSLDLNNKEQKPKKNNKIKFVNY